MELLENLKTNKRMMIIAIVSIIIFLIIFYFVVYYRSPKDKIKDFFFNQGFVLEDDNYFKTISSTDIDSYYEKVDNGEDAHCEEWYFNPQTNQMLGNILYHYSEYSSFFTPNYDYKTGDLNYSMEMNITDSKVIFTGNYNKSLDSFTCNINNSDNLELSDDNKETICQNIKDDVANFASDVTSIFSSDQEILKRITKN